ncbi:MAG: amidohydrolase [Clostridiaceae bacterium]|nr:amidohydrolase [Clostridiaceae bacterium]
MFEKINNYLVDNEEKMIEIRRHLHQYPELSFKEEKTAQYIAEFYQSKPVKVETNIGGNGVVITINEDKAGPTIAFRADFDALPIEEETDLPFKSKNVGVMHACGHDGHTAMLMAFAGALIHYKDLLPGRVKIIHQHAEEIPPGGAIDIIEAGCLEDVDAFFSAHLISTMPFKTVFYRPGATQTGRATFQIEIVGKGSHGAEPHQGNDAIVIASHLVLQLQNIVARKINPNQMAVVTIGSFEGKGIANIVQEKVILKGDVRFLDEATGKITEQEFKNIIKGIEQSFACQVNLQYVEDYPVLVNDLEMTTLLKEALEKYQAQIQNLEQITLTEPLSNSEDAAYYLQNVPGSYFYIGASSNNSFPHHNPKFDFNEKALLIGAQSFTAIVSHYFEKNH